MLQTHTLCSRASNFISIYSDMYILDQGRQLFKLKMACRGSDVYSPWTANTMCFSKRDGEGISNPRGSPFRALDHQLVSSISPNPRCAAGAEQLLPLALRNTFRCLTHSLFDSQGLRDLCEPRGNAILLPNYVLLRVPVLRRTCILH